MVHLEGTGQVLCVANHDDGDVAHENSPYDRIGFLFVQMFQGGTDGVGHLPPVDDRVHFKAMQAFYGAGISVHFRPCFLITYRVYDDGKSVTCRSLNRKSQASKDG